MLSADALRVNEFIAQYGDDPRYELADGELIWLRSRIDEFPIK